jgi:hypothetical protein
MHYSCNINAVRHRLWLVSVSETRKETVTRYCSTYFPIFVINIDTATVLPLLGNLWSIGNSLPGGFGPSSAAYNSNRGQMDTNLKHSQVRLPVRVTTHKSINPIHNGKHPNHIE